MKTTNPTKNLLPNVMAYQHDGVVKRIAKVFNCEINEANGIFQDTKRFLFLCGSYPISFAPPINIDEGWHCFILFTKDYQEFCMNFFEEFIHHYPNPENFDKQKAMKQIRSTIEIAESAFGKLSGNWIYAKSMAANLILDAGCSDSPCNNCSSTSNCNSKN
jgi:hypothetical protein